MDSKQALVIFRQGQTTTLHAVKHGSSVSAKQAATAFAKLVMAAFGLELVLADTLAILDILLAFPGNLVTLVNPAILVIPDNNLDTLEFLLNFNYRLDAA